MSDFDITICKPRSTFINDIIFDGKVNKFTWLVRYHDFTADEGGASYGSELDGSLTYPLPWSQLVAAKFALYREDGFAADSSKFWFWTQYTF